MPLDTMASISVIIPNYNRDALIGQTIENMLSQTLPPKEVIVVDDGSTDNSVDVISSFGYWVTLIEQDNQGPGAARNAGLKVATGKYVQFQDSDDLLSLNKLEEQARVLDETDADLVLGPWAHVMIEQGNVTFESSVLQQALPPASIPLFAWLLRGWATIFQSLMFRRSFLEGVGRYRTDLRYGEDMEYFFRILATMPQTAFAGNTLTLYRVDTPNKLSHDEGRVKLRREEDWGVCLDAMTAESQKSLLKVDTRTRLIFLSSIQKHLRYLSSNPDCSGQLKERLSREVEKVPSVMLDVIELWRRLQERYRFLSTGYRWMKGYQCQTVSHEQRQLIKKLGFTINT
jgi:glycosyltransferase involved in cell wall biosynthesis